MATNKIESLDPALIRPGRIDRWGLRGLKNGCICDGSVNDGDRVDFLALLFCRKIEFPMPDIRTKRRIFGIHTSKMSLSDDVDLEVSSTMLNFFFYCAGLIRQHSHGRYL